MKRKVHSTCPHLFFSEWHKTYTELMKSYKRNVYMDCMLLQKSVTVSGHKTYSMFFYVLAIVSCLSA